MGEADSQMTSPANRSMLRDFVGSISTMRGDLSTITAPPFVLDTKSTVEMPQYWSESPSVFCAPALAHDPAERALLVLRWFLSSLRGQNYMGHSEDHGVKKPLNAFLGEVFQARWEDAMGTTRLVSEQVSHHPPITACRVWNEEHGVEASGYTRQTITFSGAVTIKQTGHAMFNLSKLNESYLIPLPELKVRGIISGTLYPELNGKYYLPSTSGYTSVIDFSGKGWFGTGRKHSLEAKVFKEEDGEHNPIYTVKGTWNHEFVIHDVRKGEDIEIFDVIAQTTKATPITIEPLDQQDPWESRRAWKDVISALNRGDMKGTVEAKSKLEQGQREMRKHREQTGEEFQLRFFKSLDGDERVDSLIRQIPGHTNLANERNDTKGVWTFDYESWNAGKLSKPYHGEMYPDNSHAITATTTSRTNSIDSSTPVVEEHKRPSMDSTTSTTSFDTAASEASSRAVSARTSIDSHRSTPPTTFPPSSASQSSQFLPHSQPRRSLDTFRFPFRGSASRESKRRSVDFSIPPPSPSSVKSSKSTATSEKEVRASLSIPSSSGTGAMREPILGLGSVDENERNRRSKSLDMSLQEQQQVEDMLRNKYASGMGSQRRMSRKSRLSVSSGMDGM